MDLDSRGAGGAMQVGFGGINVNTPAEGGAEDRGAGDGGRRRIKAYAGLTLDDYKAIVDAAHKHGIRVHAHVYAEQDVRNALDAGVDVLQHVGSAGTAPPYSNELITRHRQRRPPRRRHRRAPRVALSRTPPHSPSGCRIRELKKDVRSRRSTREVQNSLKNWRSLGYFQRTDREMLFRERGVKQFIESGAVMGMGTDSGTPMNFHSEALWREIKVHVDMGMSPHARDRGGDARQRADHRQGARARHRSSRASSPTSSS